MFVVVVVPFLFWDCVVCLLLLSTNIHVYFSALWNPVFVVGIVVVYSCCLLVIFLALFIGFSSLCDYIISSTNICFDLSPLCIPPPPPPQKSRSYTALCTLRTLGDDWSRLDKKGIIRSLRHLQLDDGSFQCIAVGSEHDMRFLYCATAISYMLQDWSGIDQNRACQYIRKCKSFDGALALIPGQEGHGGSTFTGIASLVLMNELDHVLDNEWRRELIHWCVTRQVGGMQGRPNKAEDTCYSYWIGGTLRLLQHSNYCNNQKMDSLLNHEALCDFVFSCQTPMGGFGKLIHAPPDVLHSYYSLAYLSLAQDFDTTTTTTSGNHDVPSHQTEENTDSTAIGGETTQILQSLNCTLGIGAESASLFSPQVP